jgi:phosphoglycerate kinase
MVDVLGYAVVDYSDLTRPFRLSNLAAKLASPALVRIDINLPVQGGRISENNMRLQIYAHLIEVYSEYCGLLLMAHQGREGSKSLIPLKQHWVALRKSLPSDVDIEYIAKDQMFTSETKEKAKRLKKRQIILLDNMRFFPEETRFDSETCSYTQFFKGVVKTCVNDAISTWHRANSSLMCLPYIAPTFIGMRSSHELRILEEVSRFTDKALVMGGAKLQKTSYLVNILQRTTCCTGGLPAQLILRVKGYDLGPENNKFIQDKFTDAEYDDAKLLVKKYEIECPVDFTVLQGGENTNLTLKEMPQSKGLIMDIGDETLDKYADKLQGNEIRIRAGPLGVYEKGYLKGVELTKRIAGDGLIFLGGDTSQEIIDSGIDRHILDAGGQILLSGGAFLHGLAGERFPSIDLLIKTSKNES